MQNIISDGLQEERKKNMKRWKKLLAGVLAMALMLSCVSLYGMEVKAYENYGDFRVTENGKGVTIVAYLRIVRPGGDIKIPSKIGGKKVTAIGTMAFGRRVGITSVTIPSSVTNIEWRAFSFCRDLKSVTIPFSVTKIERMAFSDCSSLTSVTISSGVKEIGDSAFAGCNALTSITIPESVTRIGRSAIGYGRRGSYWVKIPNFVIYGTRGSEAERYTKEKGFTFRTGSEKTDISKASITLSKTSYTYDGKAKKPTVTVKLDGKKLSANKDYTVSYSNNIKAGTARATVTGKGNYTGKKSVTFKIVKAAEQSDSKITCKKTVYNVAFGAKPFKINATSNSKMAFTSSKPKIAAVDKNTGKVTIKNTGVATITIKAGKVSKKVTIKVSPKKPSVKSVKTAKGKKLTVSWAKDKMALGYYVQISTDKKFKKNMKSKALSKTSYTFTKLETGKKYYIRIRSYKKSGKEILYSAWSKAKLSGKIKK